MDGSVNSKGITYKIIESESKFISRVLKKTVTKSRNNESVILSRDKRSGG